MLAAQPSRRIVAEPVPTPLPVQKRPRSTERQVPEPRLTAQVAPRM
jgi:hypothetical protein